jgi:hypothetical protein
VWTVVPSNWKRLPSKSEEDCRFFCERAIELPNVSGLLRVMENVDVNAAIDLYSQSCSLYEQEDRGRFAMDTFKKAIALLVKTQKYNTHCVEWIKAYPAQVHH